MSNFSFIIIIAISILHFYIMYLEMFLWTSEKAQKIFKTTPEFAEKTKILAANQWLYNWFLASWLMISLYLPVDIQTTRIIAIIFLIFIIIAWIYGWITSNKKIFFIQSIPAKIALIAIYFNI